MMKRKGVPVLTLIFMMFILSMLSSGLKANEVKASGTIYIRADGSIDPPTANITSSDDVTYEFTDDNYGEIVVQRSNITIDGNWYTLQGNGTGCGYNLTSTSSVTIRNTIIREFLNGVYMKSTDLNSVLNNNLTSNHNGIYISYYSNNTKVSANSIMNNTIGIIVVSSNNIISGNILTGNEFTGILGGGNNNRFVDNMIIHGTNGITIGYGNSCRIDKNTIRNMDGDGIGVVESSFNSIISSNSITDVYIGIDLSFNGENKIRSNRISNAQYGISLYDSKGNNITENTITNSERGIAVFDQCLHNVVYHNNFLDNAQQAFVRESLNGNLWNRSLEGNYWSDYDGTDDNHDGIGEIPYIIDARNLDEHPLVGLFSSFNTSLGAEVNIISNSTVNDFEYFESNSTIRMFISNMTGNQTFGFCRVRIPYVLMNETVPIIVLVNGTEPYYWNYTLYDDGNNKWIYFEYEHSTLEIVIVPEFPSLIILPLFMLVTILAAFIHRRRKWQKPQGRIDQLV